MCTSPAGHLVWVDILQFGDAASKIYALFQAHIRTGGGQAIANCPRNRLNWLPTRGHAGGCHRLIFTHGPLPVGARAVPYSRHDHPFAPAGHSRPAGGAQGDVQCARHRCEVADSVPSRRNTAEDDRWRRILRGFVQLKRHLAAVRQASAEPRLLPGDSHHDSGARNVDIITNKGLAANVTAVLSGRFKVAVSAARVLGCKDAHVGAAAPPPGVSSAISRKPGHRQKFWNRVVGRRHSSKNTEKTSKKSRQK